MTTLSTEQRRNQLLQNLNLLDDERAVLVAEIDRLQLQLEQEKRNYIVTIYEIMIIFADYYNGGFTDAKILIGSCKN